MIESPETAVQKTESRNIKQNDIKAERDAYAPPDNTHMPISLNDLGSPLPYQPALLPSKKKTKF